MPRKICDLALAALGVALLVGVLALVDDRVPGRMASMARDVSSGQWAAPGTFAGNILMDLSASPAVDNMFVLAFVVVGAVLVFLMVRT